MSETQSITPFYLDKKLYVWLLTPLLMALSKKLGLDLDPAKVAGFIILAVTYILTHGAKSTAVLLAEIKAKAMAAVAKDPPPATPQAAADALGKV